MLVRKHSHRVDPSTKATITEPLFMNLEKDPLALSSDLTPGAVRAEKRPTDPTHLVGKGSELGPGQAEERLLKQRPNVSIVLHRPCVAKISEKFWSQCRRARLPVPSQEHGHAHNRSHSLQLIGSLALINLVRPVQETLRFVPLEVRADLHDFCRINPDVDRALKNMVLCC